MDQVGLTCVWQTNQLLSCSTLELVEAKWGSAFPLQPLASFPSNSYRRQWQPERNGIYTVKLGLCLGFALTNPAQSVQRLPQDGVLLGLITTKLSLMLKCSIVTPNSFISLATIWHTLVFIPCKEWYFR